MTAPPAGGGAGQRAVCGAGVTWPREGGTVHTCALPPHEGRMHNDGGMLNWIEAGPVACCAEREQLRAENERLRHRLANPCDGNNCGDGGAAHCHRCPEAGENQLLAERDRLRERLNHARAIASRWAASPMLTEKALATQILYALDHGPAVEADTRTATPTGELADMAGGPERVTPVVLPEDRA